MIEQSFSSMGEIFVLLTHRASLDVFRYLFPHSRPLIGSIYCLEGSVSPQVSCCWVIVMSCKDVSFGALFIYIDFSCGFLHDFIHYTDKGLWWEEDKVLVIFFFFVHVWSS